MRQTWYELASLWAVYMSNLFHKPVPSGAYAALAHTSRTLTVIPLSSGAASALVSSFLVLASRYLPASVYLCALPLCVSCIYFLPLQTQARCHTTGTRGRQGEEKWKSRTDGPCYSSAAAGAEQIGVVVTSWLGASDADGWIVHCRACPYPAAACDAGRRRRRCCCAQLRRRRPSCCLGAVVDEGLAGELGSIGGSAGVGPVAHQEAAGQELMDFV